MNKYRLEITGRNINYFLRKLINNKVRLYQVNKDDDRLLITIDQEDYKKLAKIKTSYKIRILNRFGIIKLKYLIFKYRFILLFFICSLFSFLFLSNIIFSVEVIHSKKEIREILYNDLEIYGISKYHFIKNYKEKENIKEKILEKEKDRIEWLEIDRIGTKYVVNVEEKKIKKDKSDNIPRNIVAKKDSMILEINSSSGEIIRKKYDYVKRGDIIISGTIMNKKREVKKIKAQGSVYGEVWYKVSITVPTIYEETTLTGNNKKVLSFIFLNNIHSLEIKKYKNYSFKEIKLFSNDLLPIKLIIMDKREEKVYRNTYNINNIDSKALSIVRSKFKDKKIISEKVLKKRLNKGTIVVDIFLKVREDITDYQTITDLELKEEVE